MKVTYITHMGSDLMVVNAARVSMKKQSDWEDVVLDIRSGDEIVFKTVLSERDKKLIDYLARHDHWTPFAHPHATLHVKVPIFVARQIMRHNVGFVYNEVSRRYVDDEPEFWWPEDGWRKRAENVKQGSSEETIYEYEIDGTFFPIQDLCLAMEDDAIALYEELLAAGVAPELARIVLPQNMYTEFYWTGSLAAFARFCKLRLDKHAQKEIRDVAQQVSVIMEELYPCSWEALMRANKKDE